MSLPVLSSRRLVLNTAVMTVLAALPMAVAQAPINTRINTGIPAVPGPVSFDANPSLTGGRINYGVGLARPISPLVGGNPFASGNVTRGLSLRIDSPVADTSAFRASLGSAALSDFRRDSVSGYDVTQPLGTGAFARPFYDVSRTAPTAGLLGALGTPQAGLSASGVRVPGLTLPSAPPVGLQSGLTVSQPYSALSAATSGSIFGLASGTPVAAGVREQIGQLPYDAVGNIEQPAITEALPGFMRHAQGAPDIGTDAAPANPVRALLQRDAGLGLTAGLPGIPGGQQTFVPGLRLPEAAPTLPTAKATTAAPPTALAPAKITDQTLIPGGDAYNDMKMTLELQRHPGAEWFEELRKAAEATPELDPQVRKTLPEDSAAFVQQMTQTPMRTFTGRAQTALNDLLLKAEAAMAIGHYNEAADRYAQASMADPRNPLPLIGKGHAHLAAGDYRSAARALVEGLSRDPSIARFPLDLKALLGGGEQVDIRRADLMRLLENNETAELRFLLGYVEYHSGDQENGLKNLQRAAELDRRGSIIGQYPSLLKGEGPLPPPELGEPRLLPELPKEGPPLQLPPRSGSGQPKNTLILPPPTPAPTPTEPPQ